MPETSPLVGLLDAAAVLSLEHQLHLEDVLGDDLEWEVSLDEPRFEFFGRHPIVCDRVHLLGLAAPGPGVWQWVWANPQSDSRFPKELTELARSLREVGERDAIAELAMPEVAFAALPGSPTEPAVAANILVKAAKVLTGRWTSYVNTYDGGTRFAYLLEHPDLQLPPPNWAGTRRAVQMALAGTPMNDQRLALRTYAELRQVEWHSPEPSRALLAGPDFRAVFHFDQDNRVTRVDAESGSE